MRQYDRIGPLGAGHASKRGLLGLGLAKGWKLLKKLRKWWTTPVIRPRPAMWEDRSAPQEFKREDHKHDTP